MPAAIPSQSPRLSSWLKTLKTSSSEACLTQLISLLKRRQISHPRQCALATTHLLLRLVSSVKFASPADLLARLHAVGRRLVAAQPHEPVLGNIVRRALGLVREITDAPTADALSASSSALPTPALPRNQSSFFSGALGANGVGGLPAAMPAQELSMKDVREDVLNGLREMLDELDQADEQVAGYALEHVAAGEVVLTLGVSRTAHKFLLAAAKRRRFTVLHVEGHPGSSTAVHEAVTAGPRVNADGDDDDDGAASEQRLKALRAAGVQVVLLPDAAVFAVMPRVSRVLLPAATLLPDGSFVAGVGARSMALAAKAYRVPVLALGAVYKLSPVYPSGGPDGLLEQGDPGEVVPFSDGEFIEQVAVLSPAQDHVSKDLVNLVITNIGAYAPSYMYRISADHYRAEDIEL